MGMLTSDGYLLFTEGLVLVSGTKHGFLLLGGYQLDIFSLDTAPPRQRFPFNSRIHLCRQAWRDEVLFIR